MTVSRVQLEDALVEAALVLKALEAEHGPELFDQIDARKRVERIVSVAKQASD